MGSGRLSLSRRVDSLFLDIDSLQQITDVVAHPHCIVGVMELCIDLIRFSCILIVVDNYTNLVNVRRTVPKVVVIASSTPILGLLVTCDDIYGPP
jgi:hypothetical protein